MHRRYYDHPNVVSESVVEVNCIYDVENDGSENHVFQIQETSYVMHEFHEVHREGDSFNRLNFPQ